MAWLNYHHLLYFWTVARAGTIAAASKELHLSQPTISTQLKTLEESLGQKLFQRQGRKLVLTDVGQTTFRYADEIFRLGKELQKALETGGTPGTGLRFAVGVADVIPKLVAQRLLEPAFDAVPLLQLECHEGPLPQLLAQLALHELDVVLSDSPAPADIKVKAFSHALGESGTTFFARAGQAASLRRGFPKSLDGTPMLLPSRSTTVRRQLEIWLDSLGVRPSGLISTICSRSWPTRPATLTMKNSSRLFPEIERKRRRSSRGWLRLRASSRTRMLKPSQDSSRLKNRWGLSMPMLTAGSEDGMSFIGQSCKIQRIIGPYDSLVKAGNGEGVNGMLVPFPKKLRGGKISQYLGNKGPCHFCPLFQGTAVDISH